MSTIYYDPSGILGKINQLSQPAAPKATAPVNTGSSGGGSTSSSGAKQNGGWYNGVQYWAPGQGPQGGSAPAAPSVDWDSIYAPQLSALDSAANSANSNYNDAVGAVDTQKTSTLTDIQAQQDLTKDEYNQQTDKIAKNQRSAYDQAINDYNVLGQKARTLYGMNNPASTGLMGLAAKEFARQNGQVTQSFNDLTQGALNTWDKALAQYNSARLGVDDWVNQTKVTLKKQLSDEINQINLSKAQTESDKASQRAQVIDRAGQAAQQVYQAQQQANIQLDSWKQQQAYLVQNSLVPQYNNVSNLQTSGYNPNTNTNVNYSPTQSASSLGNVTFNPSTGKYYDAYGNLVS